VVDSRRKSVGDSARAPDVGVGETAAGIESGTEPGIAGPTVSSCGIVGTTAEGGEAAGGFSLYFARDSPGKIIGT
jgi:hypothetical protein